MKVFSNDCTFDYSWEEVSTANWRKYCPWNDKSTHVIAVDTLSRHVDPETGIVRHPPFFSVTGRILTSISYGPSVWSLANKAPQSGSTHLWVARKPHTFSRLLTLIPHRRKWQWHRRIWLGRIFWAFTRPSSTNRYPLREHNLFKTRRLLLCAVAGIKSRMQ